MSLFLLFIAIGCLIGAFVSLDRKMGYAFVVAFGMSLFGACYLRAIERGQETAREKETIQLEKETIDGFYKMFQGREDEVDPKFGKPR